MKEYILKPEEKERSLQLFEELDGDLSGVTKKLFNDENEKGSTVRGRALRKYWIEEGLSYKTKVKKRVVKHFLTDEEKSFVKQHYCPEVTKLEVGQLLWPKDSKNKGFPETDKFIALCEYITKEFPAAVNMRDDAAGEKYTPPRILSTAIKRLNKVASTEFESEKMNLRDRKCIEKLITYLNAPRFVQVIGSYVTRQSRELFESEYIRSTWDKPDLTSDELNLYVNVCMDYVNIKEIEQQKQKLNLMFDDTEGQNDLTMRLTEMLKTKAEEYNQCINRIDKMLAKLNGERAKRVANQQQRNASVISLVQLFQDEEERKLMIKMADMQKKVVRREADEVEKMSDWKARVLGVSKEDAI
tara:strand:+ start:3211 stop:4281 length:1071 start_codon:yes stop_codon:yes gene_type:complete